MVLRDHRHPAYSELPYVWSRRDRNSMGYPTTGEFRGPLNERHLFKSLRPCRLQEFAPIGTG